MTGTFELPAGMAVLDETMLWDRHRLRRALQDLERARRSGKPHDRALAKFQHDLARSQANWQKRQASRPAITYDDGLPVSSRREELAKAIRDHGVIVVCGETGSGKSTQLPKICLELGRGIAGTIGHTQPRRLAARSIATRVAEELSVTVGQQVGYKVRFQDSTSPGTLIKLMTDGVLLAETQSDRWLNQYDTLIIDEAHERSLNIDFLLGYLHGLVGRRPDLRLIITSATIDADRFADHFRAVVGEVPILEVSGRSYPVDILYRPLDQENDDDPADSMTAIARAVDEVQTYGPGDVLVFLPTERDIHEAMKVLRGRSFRGGQPELLPLYARLSTAEQQKVFHATGPWRVVLATNVAESSLTVPRIRYVIDTGTARISRYSPRTRLQRLPVEPVAQASANQRAGRCGRLGPGICIRLFSAEDFASRERFTPPEIVRSNLASVILQTEHLGLGRLEAFPFLDPPKGDAIRDGYATLFELGAMTEERVLTDLGRQLARLPVDPRIARMICAGHEEQCLTEVLIIAAGLEVQDPRDRPVDKQQAADAAHAQFKDEESDFLGLLKIWDFYHKLKDDLSRNQLQKACRQNYLSYIRLKEWIDVHRELADVARQSGMKVQPRRNDSAAIHRALLTGFLSGIAMRTESGEYLVAGGQKAWMWPGSGTAAKKPRWIVATEQVETTRRFVRTVARIDPQIIEPLAGHLLKLSHSEPFWDAEQMAAFAWEKATLLGLIIVPKRRVRLQKYDPAKARELLIWQGLVAGEYDQPPEFLKKNLDLAKQLKDLLQRARKPGALRDDDDLYDFYDRTIPKEVYDGKSLEAWVRRATLAQKADLLMKESDLLIVDRQDIAVDQFPDHLQQGNLKLPLSYALDPGTEQDGVTLTVPQAALNQLDGQRLMWLVPGLLEEKVISLLRTVPKEARRLLVPLPELAKQFTELLEFGKGSLIAQLIEIVSEIGRVQLAAQDFDESRLSDHLRFQIRVVDETGKTVGLGRDLIDLQQRLGALATSQFSQNSESRWVKDHLRDWSFGDLPEVVTVVHHGVNLRGYPALIDQQTQVSIRLFDAPVRAYAETRLGLRRLFVLGAQQKLLKQVSHHPQMGRWKQQISSLPQPVPLESALMDLFAERAFLAQTPWPRNREDFHARLEDGLERLPLAVQEVTQLLTRLFDQTAEVRRVMKEQAPPSWSPVRSDLDAQWKSLLQPGFLSRVPWGWLSQYPRYLQAMAARWQKLRGGGLARDLKSIPAIHARWSKAITRKNEHWKREVFDAELELFLWMIEEWRVALFAQELGTAMPVSEKRLDEQWKKVQP